MPTFRDFKIDIPSEAHGEYRTKCPQCTPERKHKNERDLCVNIEKRTWHCFHCGWSGGLNEATDKPIDAPYRSPIIPKHHHVDLPKELHDYLLARGISDKTISDHGLSLGDVYDDESKKKLPAVKFPYYKNGIVVNAKHKTICKKFRQERGAESCMYRYDAIGGLSEIVVCEGEMDALACYESGVKNVTSVPDGAPAMTAKNYEKKFAFLESAQPIFEQAKRIILFVDNDLPGKKLEAELARRIGVEKCWRVQCHKDCKDANDVLLKYGMMEVRKLVKEAKPYPVGGIFDMGSIEDLIFNLYDAGEQRGFSTGWPIFDDFYTVKPGQLTIITGIPGSGKSEFLDALMVNLTLNYDWRFCVFSPENWPLQRHAQSLLEKLCKKPFGRDGYTTRRIERSNLKGLIDSMAERFYFVMPEEDAMDLNTILEKARVCVYRHGVKGLIIDPWNELEHSMGNLTETQYVSTQLGRIRRFARMNDVHVWLVAHPQKLQKDKDTKKYRPPTMYEISGGAHWRNKADVGICVHRPDMNQDITEVYVQKIRFREVGKLGAVQFGYIRDSGTYKDQFALGVEHDTETAAYSK
jgi:twinkle protein